MIVDVALFGATRNRNHATLSTTASNPRCRARAANAKIRFTFLFCTVGYMYKKGNVCHSHHHCHHHHHHLHCVRGLGRIFGQSSPSSLSSSSAEDELHVTSNKLTNINLHLVTSRISMRGNGSIQSEKKVD